MDNLLSRETVDLSDYPDMVVIYLGMKVTAWQGLKTLIGLGPQIDKAGKEAPEGLLHFENSIIFSFFPLHVGMRWYWKDFESMEKWTRSGRHKKWWSDFLKDRGGTGFWHETYFMKGGMESVFVDLPNDLGFKAFAPVKDAKGSMFSARKRASSLSGEAPEQPKGTSETELY
jgi:hypothetical protein